MITIQILLLLHQHPYLKLILRYSFLNQSTKLIIFENIYLHIQTIGHVVCKTLYSIIFTKFHIDSSSATTREA